MDGEKWPVFFEVEVGGWLVGLSVTLTDNQLGSKLHHQQLFSTNPAFTSPPNKSQGFFSWSNYNSRNTGEEIQKNETNQIFASLTLRLSHRERLASFREIYIELFLFGQFNYVDNKTMLPHLVCQKDRYSLILVGHLHDTHFHAIVFVFASCVLRQIWNKIWQEHRYSHRIVGRIPATEKFSNRIKANPQTPPKMDTNPNG